MDKDAICVVFCSPNTAAVLATGNSEIEDSLVITSLLSDDEAVVVEKR